MNADPLPADLKVSPGPIADFDEFYDFVKSVNVAQSGRAIVSREVLATVLSMPDFDQAADVRLVREGGGRLVGAAWVQSRAPFVETYGRGMVDPDRTGRGIGSSLLAWELGAAATRVGRAPAGARVTLKVSADPAHDPSVALLTDNGFSPVRYFLEMRVDFAGPLEVLPLPEGLRLVGFDPERDLERLFDAVEEAFRDHYGHVDRPRHQELARFARFLEMPNFDPSLVWMVLDGPEVAASNICVGEHEGDRSVGYVANIAVRRPWRGRGVAKAMLTRAFDEFAARGKTAAALHVDADNPTGATRLYESVGMHEVHRSAVFARVLRPGDNLVLE